MRDVIWTIIAIWVFYRIYQAIRSSRVYVYQKHDHHYNSPPESDVKIEKKPLQTEKKPNSDKGGEYVDFEEIKD
ncbi:MAG TPA: hypothetical protein VNY73_10740 [Bacteroidia bacterium]|jgi:hypothetical protein|nr:hypothetical protein [Bacteroidia bacterium]